MALQIPFTQALSHKRKVCSLYKKALRCVESWYHERTVLRYQAVLMRARFDENKDVKDECEAQQLVVDGEKELWEKQHPQPKMFPKTIGGNAYDREGYSPDWVLDFWHPLEKAQYPDYFKKREQRKLEYIKMWEKEYGKPEPSHH